MVLQRLASNLSMLRITAGSRHGAPRTKSDEADSPKPAGEQPHRRRQAKRAQGRHHFRDLVLRYPASSSSSKHHLKSSPASPSSRPSSRRVSSGKRMNGQASKASAIAPVEGELDTELEANGESSQQALNGYQTFNIPKILDKPVFAEVDIEALRTAGPWLGDTLPEYVRDVIMHRLGSAWLEVLASTNPVNVSKNSVPPEIPVYVGNLYAASPTHMLAVFGTTPQPSPSSSSSLSKTSTAVTLFPIHALVLTAFCANLPALPYSNPYVLESDEVSRGAFVTLPTVYLRIPDPLTFPILCAYLYTGRFYSLLAQLIPKLPNLSDVGDISMHRILMDVTLDLAASYTPRQIFAFSLKINALWRNVCALGISDDGLWHAIDVAWEVILTALTIASSQTHSSSN